ncbi:MAG: hypothetical protein LBD88_03275 [Candidatus Peribacteria bacterium]|nr:hypothetical protein [Candidatus Peribacteria bacterium]
MIDNNFIKILKISEKNVDAVYISTEITFTNIPSEPKAIKFYTINPQNYNWYADKRSNTYPSIFVFDNTSLAYDLEVFYIYYDKLGERQSEEILIRKKNEIISFFSRRNKVSYVILPYYEFEIPFNKAENGENSLIIRYAISENLIFTGGGITGDGFLNYSNNESVGFMEIERY